MMSCRDEGLCYRGLCYRGLWLIFAACEPYRAKVEAIEEFASVA